MCLALAALAKAATLICKRLYHYWNVLVTTWRFWRLDCIGYGILEKRPRLYIIGCVTDIVSKEEFSVASVITDRLKRQESEPMLEISDFLLADDHPAVRAELDRRIEFRNAHPSIASDEVPLEPAACDATTSGLDGEDVQVPEQVPEQAPEPDIDADLGPWFDTLTHRQQQALLHGLSKLSPGELEEALIDIQPSITRVRTSIASVKTIMPDDLWWHCGRRRLLTGRDKLTLQCIFRKSKR